MNTPIGSLSIANLQKTLYSWVRKQTEGIIESSHIVWRNQSEPLPPRPCVTMKFIDGPRRFGYQDNAQFIGGSTGSQFKIGGQRSMTLSVQIFGNSKIHRPMALQLAIDLNSSLSLLTVLDQLSSGGIAVLEQGDVLNITALEETEYEERAQFEVTLSVAQNIVDDPGIITQVGPITDVIHPA